MSPLKLGMAASFCSKPYFIFNKNRASLSLSTTTAATPPSSYHLRLRTLTPCAPIFSYFSLNKTSNYYNCDRTSRNCIFSLFRSRSFAVSSSNGLKNSGNSSGSDFDSGFVNEMRSDNNKIGSDGVVLYNNDNRNGSSKTFGSPLTSPVKHHHHQQQQQKDDSRSKFLTLPTILTLGRVAAVPLLISTFYVDSWWGRTATTSIFIAAAITDWLDGYLARKMRLGSAFGAFLDPVADKLMVAATLVLLCTKPLEVALFGQVPWLITIPAVAIIGREITMSAVREWAASQNTKLLEAVAVNNLGKWKTATQMTALTILLATRDGSFGGTGFFVASGVVLLYISAGLSLWSLAVYMSKIWRVLMK